MDVSYQAPTTRSSIPVSAAQPLPVTGAVTVTDASYDATADATKVLNVDSTGAVLDTTSPAPIRRGVPSGAWRYAAAASGIVSSTADVALKAAVPATYTELHYLDIAHDVLSAVNEFVIKDGSTIIHRGKLQTAANEGRQIHFVPPLKGSINTALNFALLSSTSGGVYANAGGNVTT